MTSSNSTNSTGGFLGVLEGNAGEAEKVITIRAFGLNIAIGLIIFCIELSLFFILKDAEIGRRIYQPKTFLVQERLRVEAIPRNPLKWIRRIFTINSEELKTKCGLDGFFFLRFVRAMCIIFLPLMALLVAILIPINYSGGKDNNLFIVKGAKKRYGVTGLNQLSWQNVAPTQTNRYWAHLICALVAISWTLYRIYREKVAFVRIRQEYLTSPEHRLKASAKTILVTNIPAEYRSEEALKSLYDIFVDNDDREKLFVWVNRDYSSLRALVKRRNNLCAKLEKAELSVLRKVNKKHHGKVAAMPDEHRLNAVTQKQPPWGAVEIEPKHAYGLIADAFEADCKEQEEPANPLLKDIKPAKMTVVDDGAGHSQPVSLLGRLWTRGHKRDVPKIAWLRSELARVTLQIEDLLPELDNEEQFPLQNSAFIQFDRQMIAHMACSLVSHHLHGRMSPRFLDVAPHEILWPNMGITSLERFFRGILSLALFVGMLFFWGIPTTFLSILSQLESLRATESWLSWMQSWPEWIMSFISGPLCTILLALLVQLIVPALCRKLAVLFGAPTRSTRELTTQQFYFAFLLVELVLVTSISSGLVATIPELLANPTSLTSILADDLPKASNYFFNYLIIQALGFSGSVLFQYLRILYITLIWPWFTQTPRQEAWLQTTIPHQMWGNVYPLFTNFAVIGLIYSVTAPLILIFSSATFVLFWIAYTHNYYYVQRCKVDTHGLLFNNALSQLFAGVYIMEVTLIGLFFIVTDANGNLACTSQAIIMIVALALTAAYHYVLEKLLQPLNTFLPVSLDDDAVVKEKRWLGLETKAPAEDEKNIATPENEEEDESLEISPGSEKRLTDAEAPRGTRGLFGGLARGLSTRQKDATATAAVARQQLSRLQKEAAARLISKRSAMVEATEGVSKRREAEDQLAAAIAGFPDELRDLTSLERDSELKAAYQDPVTRELAPVVWLPQDAEGLSDAAVESASKYGIFLQYSNTGAMLAENNKCIITEPAPDVRGDWLLDWVL